MILGIGTDLCDIRRIERVIRTHHDRFLSRIFTVQERSKATHRFHTDATFAKLFSAKEAVAKALGTGFRRGILWQDVEILNDLKGAPYVSLYQRAQEIFQEKLPLGMEGSLHISLTDEWPYVQAFVIFSATFMK